MNIHFTDKNLFNKLKSATIAKVVVGSNMYGTNTESSDIEVINSISLIGTDIEFLYKYRKTFLTYTVIRSYLGLARRDAKHFYSSKNDYDKCKKLKHVIRGYLYSRDMINNNFDFDLCNKELLSISIDVTTSKQLKEYDVKISELRNILTEKFNSKTLGLAQHINVKEGIEVNNLFLDYCNSDSFKDKSNILKDFDLSEFINSFENWVEY